MSRAAASAKSKAERRRHVRIEASLLVSWGERDDVFEGELSLSGARFCRRAPFERQS
jgi:hypothetical protein